MLRNEDRLSSNVFCNSLPPRVQRPIKSKWQVRSQTCETLCSTIPKRANSILSTCIFRVKLSDDLPELAFLLHVGYMQIRQSSPLTRKIQKSRKFWKRLLDRTHWKKTATRRLRLKRSKCVQKKCTKTTSRNGIAQGGQVALNREV